MTRVLLTTLIITLAGVRAQSQPAADVARVAVTGRGTAEIPFKKGTPIGETQVVARSSQELAKVLHMEDGDKAMAIALKALDKKEIDFDKHMLLVVSDGLGVDKRQFTAFTPTLVKKGKDDHTGFPVKDGEITVTWRVVSEGLPIGEVARPRFTVGIFLVDKFDGKVNFSRALVKSKNK